MYEHSRARLTALVMLLITMPGTLHAQQAFSRFTITVSGSEGSTGGQWDTGTLTISIGSASITVKTGQYSTAASIAAQFAALFSELGGTKAKPLCSTGVCAHAVGPTINFEIAGSLAPGVINTASTSTQQVHQLRSPPTCPHFRR